MDVVWSDIVDFPNYLVSNYGDVINRRTGREVQRSRNGFGTVKIGLAKEGKQHTRSVRVLVADAFVDGKTDIHDTPIHLNGDLLDVRASNLCWRPRWFAWKYTNQFQYVGPNDLLGPLIEIVGGVVYETIRDAAIANGLLFKDIRRSIATKESCFPTYQSFEWI